MRAILAALVAAFIVVGSAQAALPVTTPDVMIDVGPGSGSGFYIGEGTVITNAHVTNMARDGHGMLVTTDRDGRMADFLGASLIWKTDKLDVAALHLTSVPDDMQSAKLACREPVIGESIEVVGNPLGQTFIHTWGHVAGATRQLPHHMEKDEDDEKESIVGSDMIVTPIDAEIGSGNSGGPVYDAKGEVIGISAVVIDASKSKDQPGVGHVNFMIPSMVICKLMETAKHHGL